MPFGGEESGAPRVRKWISTLLQGSLPETVEATGKEREGRE